MVKCVGQY